MSKRVGLLRLLPLLPFLLPPALTSGAGTTMGVGTVVDAHGVELAVYVPRQQYPRDALVQAAVRLTNMSDGAIQYVPACTNDDPGVLVYRYDRLTPRRPVQVFPSILQHILVTPPCLPVLPTLNPGQSLRASFYIILAGRYVEGHVTLHEGDTQSTITTPLFPVQLSHADPPRISLHTSPTVYAVIRAPQHEHLTGSALYVEACDCPAKEGPGTRQTTWTKLASRRLAPSCPHPVNWYVYVGWPGHSVGSIQYVQRGRG